MWPDPEIEKLVEDRLVPVRFHVRDHADAYNAAAERYGVSWTPTVLLLDPGGVERHRIEGFLPRDEFLAWLLVALGHVAFHAKQFDEAARTFDSVVSRFPQSDAAPEAQYWAGVARYKGSGDAKELGATATRFQQRYADSVWAKKASVWG